MYCKNCGKELNENTEICMGCGCRSLDGDNFCSHCGKGVLPKQYMCVNCGFMLKEVSTPTPDTVQENIVPKKKNDYKKYTEKVKKTKTFALVLQIITLITILSLIFLPIYKYEYTPKNLDEAIDAFEDVKDLDDLNELMSNDVKMEKSFSLIEDIGIIIEGFFTKTSRPEVMMISLCVGLMAMFELIFAIVLVCMTVSQLLKTIEDLNNIDTSTMMLFNEIKKSGTSNKKENVFKKQTIITIILYAIFDILFAFMLDRPIVDALSSDLAYLGIDFEFRHMCFFSGFSPFVIIVVALLIGYTVVSTMKKREEKSLLEDITKEEYEN
ncbi:MAG: zinc ribbon domain-containing protein [Clostridia bacterium]|nr:zinc ribbon domain-containing protein [Clostridia bacterium]